MELTADSFWTQKVSKLAAVHEKLNSAEVKGVELSDGDLIFTNMEVSPTFFSLFIEIIPFEKA